MYSFLDNVLQVDSNDTLCGQRVRPTALQHATIHTVFQELLSAFRQCHEESSSPAQACCTNLHAMGQSMRSCSGLLLSLLTTDGSGQTSIEQNDDLA